MAHNVETILSPKSATFLQLSSRPSKLELHPEPGIPEASTPEAIRRESHTLLNLKQEPGIPESSAPTSSWQKLPTLLQWQPQPDTPEVSTPEAIKRESAILLDLQPEPSTPEISKPTASWQKSPTLLEWVPESNTPETFTPKPIKKESPNLLDLQPELGASETSTSAASKQRRRTKSKKILKHSNGISKLYIARVLKLKIPDMRISKRAMDIMESFVMDMFNRISKEASFLCRRRQRATLSSRDIETATRLVLLRDLRSYSMYDGLQALKQCENIH